MSLAPFFCSKSDGGKKWEKGRFHVACTSRHLPRFFLLLGWKCQRGSSVYRTSWSLFGLTYSEDVSSIQISLSSSFYQITPSGNNRCLCILFFPTISILFFFLFLSSIFIFPLFRLHLPLFLPPFLLVFLFPFLFLLLLLRFCHILFLSSSSSSSFFL